jgi:alanyl-tRNA synthetase
VFKQGGVVVHVLKEKPDFKHGDEVTGHIDFNRRMQLAQHHTSTHIINGAARKILGNHIWQAGAHKDIDKARLDITHYDSLSEQQVKEIEDLANETIEDNLPIYSELMKKNLAELEYGFRIYQGGAVPGKILRIVRIHDFDVEACGGTHLHLTGEAKKIKILKTSKIQDGIIRIEFAAGDAAANFMEKEYGVLQEAAKLLDCKVGQVPGRSQELFNIWKKVAKKGMIEPGYKLKLSSQEMFEGDALAKTAEVLRTQPEHIVKTIKRFKEDIENKLKKA